jgi:predicted phosphodiesterase
MRIQLISDTHFQRSVIKSYFRPCDVTVLAGDIIDRHDIPLLTQVFECAKKTSDVVLFVPGNHDYFSKIYSVAPQAPDPVEFDARHAALSDACIQSGVYFMDQAAFRFRDVVFIGATLWLNISESDRSATYNTISDYSYIPGYTIDRCNELNVTAVDYITRALDSCPIDTTNVVVTHHAPLSAGTCDPKFNEQSTLRNSFANNLGELVARADYWMFGHTHFTTTLKYDKCTVVSRCFKRHPPVTCSVLEI